MKIPKPIGKMPLPRVVEQDLPPTDRAISAFEQLTAVKIAAEALGLPVWKLNRAAKQKLFPTYRLLNSRRLVRLSEVVAAIEASRQGGAE